MCGLFGFAGKLESAQRTALLRALCVFNANRGEDSVGLSCINRAEDIVNVYRACVCPESAINDAEFLRVCDDTGQVWIGHTRAATRGAVSIENAHPFHIGSVIGAHNGIVSVTADLVSRCDSKDFAVDSQYLIYLLNRDGMIGEISGCAALSYVDMRNTADVSFIRHHNPLWIACAADDAWIAWSSEFDALRHSLAIAGLQEYLTLQFENNKQIDVVFTEHGATYEVSDSGVVTSYVSASKYANTCGAWDTDSAQQELAKRIKLFDTDDSDDPHADYLARLERDDYAEYLGALAESDDDYVSESELAEMDSNDYRQR